ncbi:DNase I-like protein [Serendipita vermifera]|nr:DNase I-like protein [Serendipita vermifera]
MKGLVHNKQDLNDFLVVNVGLALLVYARDDTISRHVTDVQTQWTGCGPAFMGNKGAVGVRFTVSASVGGTQEAGPGEVYTFVNAHLTAHQPNLEKRIKDYRHIVQTLLFPNPQAPHEHSNIYDTSHLFFFGDLNFRIESEEGREELRKYEQLSLVRAEGTSFAGLKEGDFWKFQCTYKYRLGKVDQYHPKRIPSWTDRILFTTASDDPSDLSRSSITPLVYTPVPSYVTSDHKPVMAILQLPSRSAAYASSSPSLLTQPVGFSNDPGWVWKRYVGKIAGWIVGWIWCLFWFVGAGNAIVGVCGSLLGVSGLAWWNKPDN